MTMNTWMKNASAALALVMVVSGQPVRAETIPVETPVQAVYSVDQVSTVFKPTVQDVLLVVCKARGYGQECAQTLLGMLWTESNNISTAIGDHGAARGYFQIHYRLHNISTDCAEDIVCSADWTITYMERHGYPNAVSYAVQCHNSCGVRNGYAAKTARNGARLWNQPLALNQTVPLDISKIKS